MSQLAKTSPVVRFGTTLPSKRAMSLNSSAAVGQDVDRNRARAGRTAQAERTPYTPLARFEELEFVAMGIDGKKILWTTMRDLAGLGERLPTSTSTR